MAQVSINAYLMTTYLSPSLWLALGEQSRVRWANKKCYDCSYGSCSWSTAKASHAALLCCMEQRIVQDYRDFNKLEQICWAQKHVMDSNTSTTIPTSQPKQLTKTRLWHEFTLTRLRVLIQNLKGVVDRHICASCFKSLSKAFPHLQLEGKNKGKRAKNE